MTYQRYAVYYTPPPGPLAAFGAGWLGWDIATGKPSPFLELPDLPVPLSDLTEPARRYGFHATLKPPFFLAEGQSYEALAQAVTDLAGDLEPVTTGPLRLTRIGRFLALAPEGDQPGLNLLASRVLQRLDAFRAPPTADELARRRRNGLTPSQSVLLERWGYPYVLQEFKFHLTLTGNLEDKALLSLHSTMASLVAPLSRDPFILDALSLVGSDDTGRFRTLLRLPLGVDP